jgi:ArsR family transcriptional regulator
MAPIHRFFKALAEPNRLRILNLLLEQPYCVCELETLLRLPQSLLSRHLAYLRNAGLVVDRRQGTRVQYSLSQSELWPILRPCLERAFEREEVYREDRRRSEQWRAGCCPGGGAPSVISGISLEAKGGDQQ